KTRGFFDYEILCLAFLWLMPAVARSFTQATFIPLAVPAMLFCFMLIYRRCGAQGSGGSAMQAVKIAS
ncbi:MAG TPA: hypothetical protein VJM78_04245, partial [Rhizomicrobium sp.]|nr:hypothetical protein [Rhizomicrobium sp.]